MMWGWEFATGLIRKDMIRVRRWVDIKFSPKASPLLLLPTALKCQNGRYAAC